MMPILFGGALHYFFGITMSLSAVFLILLVLVQRGRGGGLAGALGGAGGQSAFGTKAGDTFTRITMYSATAWILLCVVAVWTLNRASTPLGQPGPRGGVLDAPAGAQGTDDTGSGDTSADDSANGGGAGDSSPPPINSGTNPGGDNP